jgi:hypothetical protein
VDEVLQGVHVHHQRHQGFHQKKQWQEENVKGARLKDVSTSQMLAHHIQLNVP